MINTEENYKVYADEVFEVFRNGNCEQGQGYTLWKVRADLAKEVDESRLHKLYLTPFFRIFRKGSNSMEPKHSITFRLRPVM